MEGYHKTKVELPQCSKIARIISRELRRIYINTAAEPGAKIDYLIHPEQSLIIIGPESPLPPGKMQ